MTKRKEKTDNKEKNDNILSVIGYEKKERLSKCDNNNEGKEHTKRSSYVETMK